MGIGPAIALPKLLERQGLSLDDIDIIELNEAFASQVLYCQRELQIPDEKLNIYGGDIAFGHPLGAAGVRILVTLINALSRRKLKKGLASISYGGGGAIAMIVEIS